MWGMFWGLYSGIGAGEIYPLCALAGDSIFGWLDVTKLMHCSRHWTKDWCFLESKSVQTDHEREPKISRATTCLNCACRIEILLLL
jgi:hypothetical protein